MASLSGKNFIVDIFGESHSKALGAVISGVPAGTRIDGDGINAFLSRRRPNSAEYSTKRRESDNAIILSGVSRGFATGAPIAIIIENTDTRPGDYQQSGETCDGRPAPIAFRPSHADYPAFVKYGEYFDYRGGGQFSGRLTAPLCAAGAIALGILKQRGIDITAYIASIGRVDAFSHLENPRERLLTAEKIGRIKSSGYPLLDKSLEPYIIEEIKTAAAAGDSVGGVIECAATGVPAGLGEPLYDSVEGTLARVLFAIPAVKGVEFGAGFKIASMRGSAANDAYYKEGETVKTRTNNNGGITGGITNGMPVVFRVAVKPTPSISAEQDTVDRGGAEVKLKIAGRHDSCIVPRAVPVIEAAAACVILDFIL